MPDQELGDEEWTEVRPSAQSPGWAMPGSPHKSVKKLENWGWWQQRPQPYGGLHAADSQVSQRMRNLTWDTLDVLCPGLCGSQQTCPVRPVALCTLTGWQTKVPPCFRHPTWTIKRLSYWQTNIWEKYSISLAIRETQIKTTMRSHLNIARIVVKKPKITNTGKTVNSHTLRVGM